MSGFVIACGGTGGHLAPGIALAEALRARGHEPVLFLSHKRVDARLCEKYPGLRTARVPGAPFGLRPDVFARFVVRQAQGLAFSRRYLRADRPAAIVGFGGFTNAGVVLAGRQLGIPVALHEANRIPGRAIRLLSRFADRLYLPPGVGLPGRPGLLVRHTGLPVRAEIIRQPRDRARALLGVDPAQKLLVVLGGSQGSAGLNQWVEEQLPALTAEGIQVWCVTGLGKGEPGGREWRSRTGALVRTWAEPFTDRVGPLLSAADLVVSRAGAGTIAELIRCETPAILVPYPQAADNHQLANARHFEQQGGGLVLEQAALSRLRQQVLDAIFSDARLNQFRDHLHRLAPESTIDPIVGDLEDFARRPPREQPTRHGPAGRAAP